jgi:hypothetical protein
MKLSLFISKDRANNINANPNDEELDEELGDFQLPLSLTPRGSTSIGHPFNTTNVIQHQTSTSSLQHNVVLHSNIYESSTSPTNRFDLNLSIDKDENNQIKRKANSLMTVYEQSSTNDSLPDDSRQLRTTPASVRDITHQEITNEKQMV